MGVAESKELNRELTLFSPEDRQKLKENFENISGGNKKIDRASVANAIKILLYADEKIDIIVRRICDLMTGQCPTNMTVTFEGYVHCASIMINGLQDEKIDQLLYLANGKKTLPCYEDCLQMVKLFIQIYFHVVIKSPAVRSWNGNYTHIFNEESVLRLASAMASELECTQDRATGVEQHDAIRWLSKNHQFNELVAVVARHIFQFPNTKVPLIPVSRGIPAKIYPSWLTMSDILFINSALPNEYRTEWRFLFSSRIHGESFSSLVGYVVGKGPNILVIKDTDGNIFGGFASTSWSIGPQFSGTSSCFVFSLAPKMAVYESTGFNNHFQYLNLQQQTFPNGLGMGGQLNYFGFWIDAEYGKGKCSPSCTTFNCPQLSRNAEFLIDRIEVWAVGSEPEKDDEETGTHRSILDADAEGMAMLRLLQRGPVSEGLRENPTADVPENRELYSTNE